MQAAGRPACCPPADKSCGLRAGDEDLGVRDPSPPPGQVWQVWQATSGAWAPLPLPGRRPACGPRRPDVPRDNSSSDNQHTILRHAEACGASFPDSASGTRTTSPPCESYSVSHRIILILSEEASCVTYFRESDCLLLYVREQTGLPLGFIEGKRYFFLCM